MTIKLINRPKIRPVIEHLNKVFAETEKVSNSSFQSVVEHMCKFKGIEVTVKQVRSIS